MRLILAALCFVLIAGVGQVKAQVSDGKESLRTTRFADHRSSVRHPTGDRRAESRIVSHPAGCPRRAFCGCGTSLYLLGKAVKRGGLALARNWLSFPRTSCAPRMAAARNGHVFAIISCLPGNKALAYDPNSGGRKTRVHVRSLAGYKVVNPHARRYASKR